MTTSFLKNLSAAFALILLLIGAVGCGGGHSHAPDDASHEHGPDTHTHDTPAMVADTADTYVDTTAIDIDHEHGPDTHTHDGSVPAHE